MAAEREAGAQLEKLEANPTPNPKPNPNPTPNPTPNPNQACSWRSSRIQRRPLTLTLTLPLTPTRRAARGAREYRGDRRRRTREAIDAGAPLLPDDTHYDLYSGHSHRGGWGQAMTYDLDAICRPIPRCRRWVRSRCCVRTRWSCRPATLCAPACNRTWSGLQPHVVRPATPCGPACNPMCPCAPGGARQGASP